jgi:hypothetical protein
MSQQRPQRYFTRQLTTRTVYRDGQGRFISREEGIRRGLLPQTQSFYTYRDQNGRVRSASFVRRQRRRVITVTASGQQLSRQSEVAPTQVPEMIAAPSFQTIMTQQFRRILNDAVSRGVRIGVIFQGQLYEIAPQQVGDLESFFTEVEYEYLRIFEPLTGGVYLMMLHAESPNAEIFNFDSLTTAPDGLTDPEINAANEEFLRSVLNAWRRYFR